MWEPQGIYSRFLLDQPAVLCGENAVNGLVSFPGCKFAVIHGNSMDGRAEGELLNVFKKKTVRFILRSWDFEPSLDEMQGTVRELEEFCPDVIIAVGGGAVIDGAKLCRLFYECPSFEVGRTRINQLNFKTRFIAVPTTVGSGAEASSSAVYIDKKLHSKRMVVCHALRPGVVVMDPEYIHGCTDELLVTSGMDAMAHVIEGYVSNVSNPLIDYIAEGALKILYEELSKDLSGMDLLKLQYAGYQGGIIQNHCIVGSAHAVAHQLSEYGYSHREAVSLLLPCSIEQNCKKDDVRERYDALCRKAGMNDSSELAAFIRKLLKRVKFEQKSEELKELLYGKLKCNDFLDNVIKDPGGKGNPVKIDFDYLMGMAGGMQL